MKVFDLLAEIEECRRKYGDKFLNWDVYVEQIDNELYKDWDWLKDSEDWDYIKCAGWWTKFEDKKAFTINVNF